MGSSIYINNTLNTFLSMKSDGSVSVNESFAINDTYQMWKNGTSTIDGYFTLTTVTTNASGNILTASSVNHLTLEGKLSTIHLIIWLLECPRLWRITKNSLHNEGIYK